jgi:hypothetical protein
VWLPKATTLKGMMLISSVAVNKNFIAPVALSFRHTLYTLYLCSFSILALRRNQVGFILVYSLINCDRFTAFYHIVNYRW